MKGKHPYRRARRLGISSKVKIRDSDKRSYEANMKPRRLAARRCKQLISFLRNELASYAGQTPGGGFQTATT
jgi:hypothetical protein